MIKKQFFIAFILLVTASTELTLALELKEDQNEQNPRRVAYRPYSKAIKAYIEKRSVFKNEKLNLLSDLKNNLISDSDKNAIQKIYEEEGNMRLVAGKFVDDEYIVDLGKAKIKLDAAGLVGGILKINEHQINLNQYKSLSEVLNEVDRIYESDFKKSALLPKAFDLFIPSAMAATSSKFKNILKVNAIGTVYLTVNALALWRNDKDDLLALLNQIEKDLSVAKIECNDQQQTLGINGDVMKVYGVLNEKTRDTLQKIVDKSSGTVTEEKVMNAMFSKYANKEEHGEKGAKNQTCNSFLGVFGKLNIDFKLQISEKICPEMETLTSCLADLYSTDKKVNSLARNEIKKYSGDRYDNNTNYLESISSGLSK